MPRLLLTLIITTLSTQAAPKVADVPTFHLRARVLSIAGQPPTDKPTKLRLPNTTPPAVATTTAGQWSDWLEFDKPAIAKTLKGYPALYMKGFPVVTSLILEGALDPTIVEAELKLDEDNRIIPLRGELFGPNLGILLYRDDAGKAQASTMAEYNRRYWKQLDGVSIPPDKRPKRFPTIERFIGGDDDRLAWREGIDALSRAGFSAVMLPPSKPIRTIARELGVTKTAWAVYSPPGYTFDVSQPGKPAPEPLDTWAAKQAKPYLDAGWDAKDVAAFALSDEPGWYYPSAFKFAEDPAMQARFAQYLKDQNLTPADVGLASFDKARPIGRSAAKDLPSKRLFYWSMRFFPHDSARYFADATRAMEKAFYPGLPLFTNWNFFAGRFVVPGPVANNADKQSPDAAMGGHDWHEFARLRGGTMLWTEDWFADDHAYQWSFYCAKLATAARKNNLTFGGYPVARASGDRPDGLLQKVMSIVGHGGKSIKSFVFGPEYNFPGNCYSERPNMLAKFAEANAMIGAAEDLLWPGQRPTPQVAILLPRSAQAWDLKDMPIAKGISDATNGNMNGQTVDYMAEIADLYLALQHANIPADIIEEDDLSPKGLAPYKVLYVTAPNLPEENQRGLVDWLKAGGTLVTTTGAAQRDRYDEPCTILTDATGLPEAPRTPTPIPNLAAVKESAKGTGTFGPFTAFGPVGKVVGPKGPTGQVFATFADNSPAIVAQQVGKGRAVHFAFAPGLSYAKSPTNTTDRLPTNFSKELRAWIESPTRMANVQRLVTTDQPMVETPILLSDGGAAITLLNWTGQPIDRLTITARLPFKPRTIECVRAGKTTAFEQQARATDGGGGTTTIAFKIPLGAADVVMLRP